MATEIKWEKVDSQNIRMWQKCELTYKPDLQQEKGEINNVLALSDSVLAKILSNSGLGESLEQFKQPYQDRLDEINYLLGLYNDSTTSEDIDFIDL